MAAQPFQLPDLSDFCRRWKIARLEVFGSVLRDDFGPGSDIDLMYTPEPTARWTLSQFLQLQKELESILGRNVDFVARDSVERSRNWYRRDQILSTARLLYAA